MHHHEVAYCSAAARAALRAFFAALAAAALSFFACSRATYGIVRSLLKQRKCGTDLLLFLLLLSLLLGLLFLFLFLRFLVLGGSSFTSPLRLLRFFLLLFYPLDARVDAETNVHNAT